MSTGWRAWLNRQRRRVARALFFRMLFGESSMGRWRPNTRISPSSCIEHEERLDLGDHVFIGAFNFIEASGGITLKTLPRFADLGLDFVSTGALVHQSVWVDIGLDWRT